MRRIIATAAVLAVLGAACSGGDDAATSTTGTADGAVTTTQAATTTTLGATIDFTDAFCVDLAAAVASQQLDVSLTPDSLQAQIEGARDALLEAAGAAPSEIASDVQVLADAFVDLTSLLDEVDYDFLRLDEIDPDDPRLSALDDPALAAAGDAIGEYCGVESPDPGAGGGTGGIDVGDDLPEGLDPSLVPPGVTDAMTFTNAGIVTVQLTVDLTFDELVAFYTTDYGDPFGNDGQVAQWITPDGVSITVADDGPAVTAVITIFPTP